MSKNFSEVASRNSGGVRDIPAPKRKMFAGNLGDVDSPESQKSRNNAAGFTGKVAIKGAL